MADFYELGGSAVIYLLTKDTTDLPKDADSTPTYVVYGPTARMSNGSGTFSSFAHSGNITGATNASPIVITTSANHNLVTGQRVRVQNVGGNTAANGYFTVTVVTSTTFSLDGSTGNGTYTSGGTFHIAGFYRATHSLASGDGYERGENYLAVASFTVDGDSGSAGDTFNVV